MDEEDSEKGKIVMFYPYMPEEAIKAVSEVLKTRWIGQGPKVNQVEEKFSRKFNIPKSVTVNNGTAALHLALKMANVGPGDEVITTPMTCSATNIPILYTGAKAVFADIQEDTLNIDPKSIEEKITPNTKAIMVVHWAGYPCDMDEIHEIAKKHNLKVIEDAAHALGASYKGKYVGSISDFTCFSFQAIKQITTIDGGMLTMQTPEHQKRAKILRWYGIDKEFEGDVVWKYNITEIGHKYHMNDVTATILEIQLDHLDRVNQRRREITDKYTRELNGVQGLTLLTRKDDRRSGNWLFTILVDRKQDFIKKLNENNIEATMVHVRNDICPIFGEKQNLPVMDRVEDKYVSIPLHNHLSDGDVSKIIETIKSGW